MTSKSILISKVINVPFNLYKGKACRLSLETPHTVDEVVVGLSGKNKRRTITTFRDVDGNIIERAFDYHRKPFRNIVYKKYYNEIGADEFVVSTCKKEYFLPRGMEPYYRSSIPILIPGKPKDYFWIHTKCETDHVATVKSTGEKIISRTSVSNIEDYEKSIHKFIEFPHLINKKLKGKLKFLYFNVSNLTNKILRDSVYCDGLDYSKNDLFLPFRAYDVEDLKVPITRKFLEDEKLNRLWIRINANYFPPENERKLILAEFCPDEGLINFNAEKNVKSKKSIVKSSRHEVQHVWQYYLDARNTEADEGWQGLIYKKFGPLKNKALMIEAQKYSQAIENYVPCTDDYNAYLKNYIEQDADKVARIVSDKYERQMARLSKSLPHIPKELL